MPLQNYYAWAIIERAWERVLVMSRTMREGMEVLYFYYQQMVIRHHLAAEKQATSPPVSSKAETTDKPAATPQPPTTQPTPNPSKPATAKSSNTDQSKSQPTTTPSTTVSKEPTSPHETTTNASSKPTTQPSPLDSKTTTLPPSSTPQTKSSATPPESSTASTPKTPPSTSPQSTTSQTTKKQQNQSPVSQKETTGKPTSSPSVVATSTTSPQATNQPVKSLAPAPIKSSLSAATTSSNNQGTILGVSSSVLMQVGVALFVIAIIVIIIIILYRRYKTRLQYNQSPQNFAHKPDLAFSEEYYLNHNKIEKCLTPQRIVIEEQNQLNGKIYQVQFKGMEKSAVYFHRRQVTTTYFEVEVMQANGTVEIGFIPINSFPKLKNGEENIGSVGVGITNNGLVQAEGENIYNYSWSLAFGDVFGLGITRENSKFSERRAWISKNGVLLNYPPNDEMDKWLATIEISAEEKAQYNIGVEKKEGEEEEDAQDQQKIKEKAQRQKIEVMLKKQRISLKTFNKFEYYPVVVCHGNKDDNKSTIINVNVGGQIFRMYDTQFRSGLLKDKALFGDD